MTSEKGRKKIYMNKVIKASLLFVLLPVTAVAQEKADQYNPVDYAVVSQTIALMPVPAVWVMLVRPQTLT